LAPSGINSNGTSIPTIEVISGSQAPTPTENLIQFLTRTLTTDGSLGTSGTPQNDALLSLQTNFPDLVPTNGDDDRLQISQIYSLNTLYFSTNGTSWKNSNNWASATFPCDSPWFGVTCNGKTVVSLNLTDNDLLGPLPSEIQGLSNLGMLSRM
jgi:hypothetical protein